MTALLIQKICLHYHIIQQRSPAHALENVWKKEPAQTQKAKEQAEPTG